MKRPVAQETAMSMERPYGGQANSVEAEFTKQCFDLHTFPLKRGGGGISKLATFVSEFLKQNPRTDITKPLLLSVAGQRQKTPPEC
jgi:hypothetical protein